MQRFIATVCILLLAFSASADQAPMTAKRVTLLPEPLVFLAEVDPTIQQDIRYATADNFTGAPVPGYRASECVIAKPAAEALARVQAALKSEGLSLKVYDCYRPLKAVEAFVAWAKTRDKKPATKTYFPNLRKDQLVPLGYIAEQSGHSRGWAVDLTLMKVPLVALPPRDPKKLFAACTAAVDKRAPDNSVDMGTGYDCFDTLSHTASTRVNKAQRGWRSKLLAAMAREKFTNFEKEWWHFVYPSPDQSTYDFEILKRVE